MVEEGWFSEQGTVFFRVLYRIFQCVTALMGNGLPKLASRYVMPYQYLSICIFTDNVHFPILIEVDYAKGNVTMRL